MNSQGCECLQGWRTRQIALRATCKACQLRRLRIAELLGAAPPAIVATSTHHEPTGTIASDLQFGGATGLPIQTRAT